MASQGAERTPATATAGESSPLLRLPAELRNDIYRLVVVSPNAIRVGVTGFNEPPILTVSKQIRREASAILFAENSFVVTIHDYNVTGSEKWTDKMHAANQLGCPCSWKCGGSFSNTTVPNWMNLLEWMKGYHAGSVRNYIHRPSTMTGLSLEYLILGGMFVVVESMKGQPWHEVDRVLQEHRRILAAVDARWNN